MLGKVLRYLMPPGRTAHYSSGMSISFWGENQFTQFNLWYITKCPKVHLAFTYPVLKLVLFSWIINYLQIASFLEMIWHMFVVPFRSVCQGICQKWKQVLKKSEVLKTSTSIWNFQFFGQFKIFNLRKIHSIIHGLEISCISMWVCACMCMCTCVYVCVCVHLCRILCVCVCMVCLLRG